MNQQKLDQLIQKLGMTSEIKPLLESNADGEIGYERFERAVEKILDSYKENGGRIKVKEKRKIKIPNYRAYKLFTEFRIIDRTTYKSIKKLERSIEYFKRNYGICCKYESLSEISERENLSRERINQKIHETLNLLKSKHKKDLWYETL